MICSVRHCTANENGEEELAIERYPGILKSIALVFKHRSFRIPKTITDRWVMRGGVWVNADTGDIPSADTQLSLSAELAGILFQSRMLDKC